VHGAVPDYVLEVLATGSAGGEAVRTGTSCTHSNNIKCVRRKFSSNSGKGGVQRKVSSNSSKGVQVVRRKSSGQRPQNGRSRARRRGGGIDDVHQSRLEMLQAFQEEASLQLQVCVSVCMR